jgi:hypothetical protein
MKISIPIPLKRLFLSSLTAVAIGSATASVQGSEIALKEGHPDQYVVQEGDTLWDIAGRFLQEPWQWPQIWQDNRQIENPNMIYPGDVVDVADFAGQPRLTVSRGRVKRLAPGIRREPLSKPIHTIPFDAIAPFLTMPYVVSPAEVDQAPYLVHFSAEHIVGGAGDLIYVRAIEDDSDSNFHLIRKGKPLTDPDTGRTLGYHADFVSAAKLLKTGDPATLRLFNSREQAAIGDRLLPVPEDLSGERFIPRPAPDGTEARIIGVIGGVSQIGQYNVVVINRGEESDLQPGDVLKVYKGGHEVRDTVSGDFRATVTLPYEETGIVMIFRRFDQVSFGLVMKATDSLHIGDRLLSPQG